MSVIFKRQASFFFSSEEKTGATNISQNGSVFDVILSNPISIPSGAVNAELAIINAQVWYVNPNVSVLLANNKFKFTTTNAPAGTYTLTLPDGLYSLPELNSTISNAIINLGLPATLFRFT